MDEKVLETIIATFTKELINESKVIFNDILDEAKNFIGADLKKYLEKQKIKYAHIKTLLRGNTPVYLYEIYFPINLVEMSHGQVILTNNISNIFEESNYATIIGDAGSGKSTLIKHLFLNSIQHKYGIPILVELRYLNETDGNIEQYILDKIFENKISANLTILNRLLENGRFVFFLDGFDELNIDIKASVVRNLNTFINKYDTNKFIITSRPYSNIEEFPLFYNYRIKQLENSSGEIDGFIDHQLKKEKELGEKIKKSLKDNKSEYIQSFLTNPLLLTLYILTFQTNAEIPNKKYIFYRRVINALFSEHDSKTKLGYVREKRSKLTQENFEEILKAFCFLSYFEQRIDFDFDYINETLKKVKIKIPKLEFDNSDFIYDLTSAISLWTEDNGLYGFAHRSLQEYFAALFIKNLNPIDNERAYAKVIEKFGTLRRAWEVENFLSLCQEMDEVNFNKFYYLPLLKEIASAFDDKDNLAIVKSFILFFAEGFTCAAKDANKSGNAAFLHKHNVNVKESVYKTIYIHLPFTRKLFNLLLLCAEKDEIINHNSMKKDKNRPAKVLTFDESFETTILPHLINDDIVNLANEFYQFLNSEIENSQKLIDQSSRTDRELLDLI